MKALLTLLLLAAPALAQQPQSLPLYPVLTDAQQAENRAAAARQERAAMEFFAKNPAKSTTYQSCASGNCGSGAAMPLPMPAYAPPPANRSMPPLDTDGWRPAKRPVAKAAADCSTGDCSPATMPSYPTQPPPVATSGRDGKDGRDGERGPQGAPGRDAEPVDYDRIEAMIVAALARMPAHGTKGDRGPVGPAGPIAEIDYEKLAAALAPKVQLDADKLPPIRVNFMDESGIARTVEVRLGGSLEIPPVRLNIYDDIDGNKSMSDSETFKLTAPLGAPLKIEVTGGINARSKAGN